MQCFLSYYKSLLVINCKMTGTIHHPLQQTLEYKHKKQQDFCYLSLGKYIMKLSLNTYNRNIMLCTIHRP